MVANLQTLTDSLAEMKIDSFRKGTLALMALGLDDKQIADCLGEKVERVRSVRAYEDAPDIILKIQVALGFTNEQKIANLVASAIQVKSTVLSSGAANLDLKNRVADSILDRAYGKPTQTIRSIQESADSTMDMKKVDQSLEAIQKRLAALTKQKAALRGEQKVIDI